MQERFENCLSETIADRGWGFDAEPIIVNRVLKIFFTARRGSSQWLRTDICWRSWTTVHVQPAATQHLPSVTTIVTSLWSRCSFF